MEDRRLIISKGSPEIEGSLYIDAILEDGRRIFGFWARSLVSRQYRFHVCLLDSEQTHTYRFRSLSAMICAFNAKLILTINSDGDVVL